MMNHSRREKWMQTSSLHNNNNNKRKEIDSIFNVSKPLPLTTKKLAKPSQHHKHPPPLSPKPSPKPSHNHLLAGYLAHEFLSKGTLFGQTWDPARAEAIPVGGSSRVKQKQKRKIIEVDDRYVRYKEVTEILKSEGAHIPGIVNPTQLGRFLQLG
ncbi:hypothetical protein LIER_06175 [Lithospermum erythrorhizon]|uniref:Uncharacterized protein n=1 Tax=Lithospermum erythrorhizon TaxID=34254 RepID=A0AAV3P4I8_LITER